MPLRQRLRICDDMTRGSYDQGREDATSVSADSGEESLELANSSQIGTNLTDFGQFRWKSSQNWDFGPKPDWRGRFNQEIG